MKRKIRIGNIIYKIVRQNKIKDMRTGKYSANGKLIINGEINCYPKKPKSNLIKIRKDLKKSEEQFVLFHEISHGILYELRSKTPIKENKKLITKLNKNEDFVSCLAEILQRTFKLK